MSKIGIFTDTHFGVKKDSQDRLNISEKSLDYIIDVFKNNGVSTVIFGGDLWHNRNRIGVNTLDVGFSVIQKLMQNFTVYFVLGNHDIHYRHKTEVHSLKFLNLAKDNLRLIEKITEIDVDGKKILLIPWLEKHAEITNAFKEATATLQQNYYDYVVGHLDLDLKFFIDEYINEKKRRDLAVDTSDVLAYINDLNMLEDGNETSTYDEISKYNFTEVANNKSYFTHFMNLCKPGGIIFSGHYHKHVEYNLDEDKRFIFVGSPYEMTWADVDNPKGFYILDLETNKPKFYENTFGPKHTPISLKDIKLNGLKLENVVNERSIIKLLVDCDYEFYEINDVITKINQLKPFEIDEYVEIASFNKQTDFKDVEFDENTSSYKTSKLNYLLSYIEKIQPEKFTDLDKDRLLKLTIKYFNTVTKEQVSEK